MNRNQPKWLKRAVPLILALLVLSGTFLSCLSVVLAHAAEADAAYATIDSIHFLDTGNAEGQSSIMDTVNTDEDYILAVQLRLTPAGREAFMQYHKTNPDDASDMLPALSEDDFIRSVRLTSGNVKGGDGNSRTTFSKHSRTPEIIDADYKGSIRYTLYLGPVRLKEDSGRDVSIEITYSSKSADGSSSPDGSDHLTEEITDSAGSPLTLPGSGISAPIEMLPSDKTEDKSDILNRDTENAIPTPKMIITGFDIPDQINYGEDFDVTLRFYNNSAYKDMVNVTMTVTPSDGTLIRNGLNQRHFVRVPKHQTGSETFRFRASSKLASEAVTLTVKFAFEYEFNGEYKREESEEILSILSSPKPDETPGSGSGSGEGSISSFEILSVVPPEEIYPGEESYITARIINKDHQFDASNVQMTITGDGLANSGSTVYHGALAHSSQAEIETMLLFNEPGTYTLECTVIYEDSVGTDENNRPIVRINDLKKEFTVTVLEAPGSGMDMGMDFMDPSMDMGMGFDENMEEPASPLRTVLSFPWILIPIAVLIVAAVLVIRHFRSRKKDENDEDL